LTTPLIALFCALFITNFAYASTNSACAYVDSKRADVKIMTDFDDYLVDTFHQRNKFLVSEINRETLETYAFARHALTIKTKDISRLAKRLKAGETVTKGKNVRRVMDAKIMRDLPAYMTRNWFYQENYKDGKKALGPMFAWPESTIRQVAADEIPTAYRASSIRRIKSDGKKGFVPVINSNVESGVTINGDMLEELANPKLGLRPWEVAIYGSLKTKETPTQYPPTHVNNNQTKADSYYLEYTTSIYILDLTNGQMRVVNSPLPEYHSLAGTNMGAARIVSDTRMQRMSLENEVTGCN
jgi:hypothetical protein